MSNDFADMFAKATEKTANLLASMNNFQENDDSVRTG